jgi:tetratricopeptide (TPR) repeat protein
VLEEALELAESHRLLAVLSDALNTKGLLLGSQDRCEEGRSLLEGALRVAEDSGVATVMMRAYGNLSYTLAELDKHRAGLELLHPGIELARRVGDRDWEWFLQANVAAAHCWLGEWDEVDRIYAELTEAMKDSFFALVHTALTTAHAVVHVARGAYDEIDQQSLESGLGSSDVQERGSAYSDLAGLLAGRGEYARAFELARHVLEEETSLGGIRHPNMRLVLPILVESALACDELAEADHLVQRLEQAPSGRLSPFLAAQLAAGRARLDDANGLTDGVEDRFRTAIQVFEVHELTYYRAQVQGHLAEWLARQGRRGEAEQVAAQALATFERLRAAPWVERLAPLRATSATA